MATLTLNTSVSNRNAVLTMPATSIVNKKTSSRSNYITYSANPKSWYRKSTVKRFSSDWDVFKSELEFE